MPEAGTPTRRWKVPTAVAAIAALIGWAQYEGKIDLRKLKEVFVFADKEKPAEKPVKKTESTKKTRPAPLASSTAVVSSAQLSAVVSQIKVEGKAQARRADRLEKRLKEALQKLEVERAAFVVRRQKTAPAKAKSSPSSSEAEELRRREAALDRVRELHLREEIDALRQKREAAARKKKPQQPKKPKPKSKDPLGSCDEH